MKYVHLELVIFRSRGSAPRRTAASRRRTQAAAGLTLIELILACAILMILATAALPLARVAVMHHKEDMLHYDLREMRDAIDRYKDAADQNKIQVQADTDGYPPDLQTLVDGVSLNGAQEKRIHFLREIPVDPMTGSKDWGMRSVQDDPDSTEWSGTDVFDVYSKSTGTALDGTKYSDW
ncbi:MAG: type II secretion system protein [Candidatus Acidiferrales bacterium]